MLRDSSLADLDVDREAAALKDVAQAVASSLGAIERAGQRQLTRKHGGAPFDVDALDRAVAAALRGLQPADVRRALDAASQLHAISRRLLQEIFDVLVEIAEMTGESA